ncbi:CbtA family protein [Haloechinothrix sp. YIM 98757]|uniref:CbtA family protein n=1 Tax=Haloechinothrix aidingensis TaxID=2752311 RepID=A0A838ABS6_9PSEU|nr:CbtA family protein [Haloechinothrix aidingensis]MBA0126699.1 CbtA family protein [Haloechinothrix aidingensis]
MMRTLLVRGLLAGLLGGVVAAVFAYVVGQPLMDAAIEVEEAAAHGHDHGDPLVGRGVQSTFGLLVAHAAYGVAIGGLFSLLFALAYGRFGAWSPRAYAAVLATGAFLAVSLVPFLAYPANPPGVGEASSVNARTAAYFGLLAISVVAAGIALYVATRLTGRWGGFNTGIALTAGYLAVVTVSGVLLPGFDEADGFPAELLWDFRVAALGNLVVFWVVLGVAFGALAQRSLPAHASASAQATGLRQAGAS